MFVISIPLPVCVIIGSNMTFEQVDVTNDIFLTCNLLFGAAYILLPFNWLYTYMKNAAIDEKNSKLET
jgi:hypothetical protein